MLSGIGYKEGFDRLVRCKGVSGGGAGVLVVGGVGGMSKKV